MYRDDAIDYAGILEGLAPAEEYTPDDEERKLVERFHTLFEQSKDARYYFARAWEYNRLMIEGEQLLYRDNVTHEYVKVTGTDITGRLYSINNKLQPTARSLHGKLCRRQPKFNVVPASTDQTEMHGSIVADALIKYFDNRHKMDLIWSVMKFNELYTGNSIIQLCWDPQGGRRLATCLTCSYTSEDEELIGAPCPDCADLASQGLQFAGAADALAESMGEQTAPPEIPDIPTLSEVREGEEKPVAHKVENVFIDPSATEMRDARYVIVRHNLPLSEARRMLPDKAAFIRATGTQYIDDISYQTLNLDTGSFTRAILDDHVTIFEYHERATDAFPDGRIMFFGNNMVLDEKPGYFKLLGRLPFFSNHWWKYPTRFWAQSFIDSAAPRQRELNELETHMREYQELIARAKLLAPIGSLSPDEWSSRTSQVVFYNRNVGKPEILSPPNMPQSVYERRDALVADIREHGTTTAAEAGLQTDDSGRALAILEAEGDQQIEGMARYNAAEMSEFYRGVILLIQTKRRPDWKFVFLGDAGPELYNLEDLKLSPGWGLCLEQDDGLSNNRATRLNEVSNLIGLGLLNDPQTGMVDRVSAAKIARLRIPGLAPDIRSTEHAAAQANLKRIEHGDMTVQPEIADDPTEFSTVYLHWLRTRGRRPDIEQQVKQYVEQLYMYYVQQMMLSQAGQQTQPGAPTGTSSEPNYGSTQAQTQSAPGGTPNGAGTQQQISSGNSIAGQSAATVKNADAAGERLARSGPHE